MEIKRVQKQGCHIAYDCRYFSGFLIPIIWLASDGISD